MKDRSFVARVLLQGIRFGLFMTGVVSVMALLLIGFLTCRARFGGPGAEILLAPAFLTCIYCGYTMRSEKTYKQRARIRETLTAHRERIGRES